MNCLYTISKTSEILGVNKNKVYDLIKHGHIQALKLGSMKISSFELDDFMKRNAGKDFSDLENVKELKVIYERSGT
ncbi:helix-turn-helix domain-containing protein [Paraliobacillus zengyii]|uniref:helix-turn-helix domain-containing protein n=1 Tax=Paraliobacillus zengyii TaxID=2213194 RepID=UPI000DD3DC4A|nr:helix-turn-helix domain-containing protein [Paraliobacillus zengyii]